MSQRLFLPDFMANYRYPPHLNPNTKVRDESAKWIASFGIFSARAQKFFDIGQFGLLTRLAYPLANAAQLRVASDAMNLFFAIDDIVDGNDTKTVMTVVDNVMDALRHWEKPRPAGENPVSEAARQLAERLAQESTALTQRRWIEAYEYYLVGNVQENMDRHMGTNHTIESFMEVRCRTIGCMPSYVLLEMGLDLEEEQLEHPLVKVMHLTSTKMVCLCNDILSYNKEQAIGSEFHNIVSIAMRMSNLSVQEAFNWTARYHNEIEADFNNAYDELKAQMPLWGDKLDAQVLQYCDGMGNWARANYEWSYSTPRYFGSHAEEAKRERWVTLLPKQAVFAA